MEDGYAYRTPEEVSTEAAERVSMLTFDGLWSLGAGKSKKCKKIGGQQGVGSVMNVVM